MRYSKHKQNPRISNHSFNGSVDTREDADFNPIEKSSNKSNSASNSFANNNYLETPPSFFKNQFSKNLHLSN